ncbi:MAG: hypothetical protein RIB32_03590 [Phycisphaerales bacterium]
MTPPVVLLKNDVSRMLLVGDSGMESFEAMRPADGDSESAPLFRQRVESAASWLGGLPTVRKRVAVACIDVDETLCTWIQAPGHSPQLIQATLRDRAQEWRDLGVGEGVETLTAAEPRTGPGGMTLLPTWMTGRRDAPAPQATAAAAHDERVSVAVLTMPDALPRLWHDALDRRGIRVDVMMSLWHAMAQTWGVDGPDEAVTATILYEPGRRLTWSWSRDGALLAAGAFGMQTGGGESETFDAPESAAAALRRLVLDWLTWSSQLGQYPDRIILVGCDADAFEAGVRRQWPDVEVVVERRDDPTDATMRRLFEHEGAVLRRPRTSQHCLQALTRRPTRAMRTRYISAGAALLLLAVAIGGFGFRVAASASEHRNKVASMRADLRDDLRALNDSDLASSQNPAEYLGAEIIRLSRAGGIEAPPEPRPLVTELMRFTDLLNEQEDVFILSLLIGDSLTSVARLELPSENLQFAKEKLLAELNASDEVGKLDWDAGTRSVQNQLTLSGRWK